MDTKVKDVRPALGGEWRLRQCASGHQFETLERVDGNAKALEAARLVKATHKRNIREALELIASTIGKL